ncbi:MAG TPA: recombinase family protein [Verrucomicrobiae bacterium]|nr:recombinase family protein [Verrucomicrobiae bacterium]
MSDSERIRESCNGWLDPQYVRERQQAGWRLVGVEWEREAAAKRGEAAGEGGAPRAPIVQELPMGSRMIPEGGQLVEDADEMKFLHSVMELIIQDISIVKVAEELNRRGFRTRTGKEWGPVAIFNLLPRLIELTPRIFRSEEWVERRKRLTPVF